MRWPRPPGGVTAWSLVALAIGYLLGAVGHATGSPAIAELARALEPLGAAWLGALKLLVLPLVVLHVMAAIVSARESASGLPGQRGRLIRAFGPARAVIEPLTTPFLPIVGRMARRRGGRPVAGRHDRPGRSA